MQTDKFFCCKKIETIIYKKLGSLLKYCSNCYKIFGTSSKFIHSSENHIFIRENEDVLLNCTICNKKLYHLRNYLECTFCTSSIKLLDLIHVKSNPEDYYCCRSIIKNYYKGHITEFECCTQCYLNYYIFDDTSYETNIPHTLVRGNIFAKKQCSFCYTPFYKLADLSECKDCAAEAILNPLPLDLSFDKNEHNHNLIVKVLLNA